jgi:glyoxylase-like metal-dependent hydrolase (beta-lactamase superfamily II)
MLLVSLTTIIVSAQEKTPNVFTYKVGAFEVSLLSEGQGLARSGMLVGATPAMMEKCLKDGACPNSCNAFLVRMPGKMVLVDTGYGPNLVNNLKSLGVSPEQIDAILITHMHGDHIGGILNNDRPAFPNAEIYISKPEYDYIMSDGARNPTAARKVIDICQANLRFFQPTEIDAKPTVLFPGINAVAAFGHTPGHTLYMVESGKEKLLIWGDLTHAMAIQMPYPQVAVSYDVNPDMAIAARKKVLAYAAKKKIPVAGMHHAFPGMGTIKKKSAGYLFTPINEL